MQPPGSDKRCLLVDAMGTLVRLAPPAPRLRGELGRRFGIDVSLEQAQRAIGAEIRYYHAHMGEGRDPASVRALRGRCAEAMRSALPKSERLSDLDAASLTEALLASIEFSAFEDAGPALTQARARGRRVVVVSNWDHSLCEVLDRLGFGRLLDGVVTSAAVGVGKPDPAIFEAALRLAGAQAGEALHVGDSLKDDIVGARAAGVAVVWLNRAGVRGSPAPPGVPVIASLAELDRQL
jgi:putative hydrolase of the HAD superfamily